MENKCGSRIKARLQELSMTQADLCRKTGINSGTMSQYVSGKYYPTQDRLEMISTALKTTPAYLMGWSDMLYETAKANNLNTVLDLMYNAASASDSDNYKTIINIMHDLDDAGQEQLINYGKFLLSQKE